MNNIIEQSLILGFTLLILILLFIMLIMSIKPAEFNFIS